ncbi:MAG: recombination protein RecR [Solobacterium sp.]|nr:recombination protein RecR [Solobacterium sp.]
MYPKSLQELIEAFRKLPGVGEKSAERYALNITDMQEEDVRRFAQALVDVKTKLRQCKICGNLSEEDECEICKDTSRNAKQIVVVQSAKDVLAMERLEEFNGTYHVLNGLLSSSKGIMPEDLNIDTLIKRAQEAEEIILATSTTMDGEMTALYLNKILKKECPSVLVTRIAHGLPSGGFLDYADEMTLAHALSGRRKVEE